MSEHALDSAAVWQFWAGYLLPTLGIAVGAVLLSLPRMPLTLLAGCVALVVEGYAALVHSGGGVNDLLPAYLAVAVLAGLALGGWAGVVPGRGADRLTHAPTMPRYPGKAWHHAPAAAFLVIAQLAVLVAGFRPGRAIPAAADRAAGLRLAAGLRTVGGTVAIPADPALALTAGLPAIEDQFAAADVLRASDPAARSDFTRSISAEVAARRFTMIITELNGDLRGFPPDLTRYYHRCPQMPPAGIPPAPFRKSTAIQPVSLWLPVGRGSCAAIARALVRPLDSPAQPGAQSRSGAKR